MPIPLAGSRSVVLHVDDLGASHGANQAFLELAPKGLVTCGSVVVPGPWFREMADAACADPGLAVGVHLTLTSEWDACRWAPLSTVSRASGLIDGDGYFWRDVGSLRRAMVVEAAELELRAQVERAVSAGMRPTHLDAHMGAAMLPELLGTQIRLAHEFGLMPILPRSIRWVADVDDYRAALARLDAAGLPVIDHGQGTFPVEAALLHGAWRDRVGALPGGVTHLMLHCTVPGEFAAMAPGHAGWRFAEYEMLATGRLRDMLAAEGVGSLSTRELQAAWQAAIALQHA